MGCCDSKPKTDRRAPSFSVNEGPPREWTVNFHRSRGISSQSATGQQLTTLPPTGRPPPGHSHTLDVPPSGAGGNLEAMLCDGVDPEKVFTPKVGTALIFQESTSQDVLCVAGDKFRNCSVSSVKTAASFKVTSIVRDDKNGDVIALRFADGPAKGAADANATDFLYFDDESQKLHCASSDGTAMWQLVELIDDVVDGKRSKEATYVLRVVAQWWFPAVILRHCKPPTEDTYLSEDGRERVYSVTYPVPGLSEPREVPSANPDDSPATAAFNRLQKNADKGYSSSFEESFASSEAGHLASDRPRASSEGDLDVLDSGIDIYYAVRFRNGAVEAVSIDSLRTADQLRAQALSSEQSEDGWHSGPVSFAPGSEVFVGPPHFEGLGQFVCRAEVPRTPTKKNARNDDADSFATPLLQAQRQQRREAELSLSPQMEKAVRWNLMLC